MDADSFLTPRKLLQNALARTSSRTSMTMSPSLMAAQTPKSLSRTGANSNRINMLPIVHTPPSRLLNGRVVNPFEPHLADRFHLPMIGSPSLFHRPSTPHNSSTSQFEWTIDDVSSLGPVNVEVHETQFLETPDPDREARVQAAISTYFKEHSIVPSPIDCQLRSQKIVLSTDSARLSPSAGENGQSKRKTRDGVCQTVLTFPPKLPRSVEKVLQKYLTFEEDQQQNHSCNLDESSGSNVDHDARDASLRRKLFNLSHTNADTDSGEDPTHLGNSLDDLDLKALSPAPVSPEVFASQEAVSQQDLKRSRYFRSEEALYVEDISLSPVVESDAESSFGALSPISKSTASSGTKDAYDLHHSDLDNIYRSTPEPLTTSQRDNLLSVEQESESRLYINGSVKHTELTNVLAEASLSNDSESNMSSKSPSLECSHRSQTSTTPLRRHGRRESRRNNRKNLSQSFQLINESNHTAAVGEATVANCEMLAAAENSAKPLSPIKEILTIGSSDAGLKPVNFYRADSGFNEENPSSENATNDLSDVSMLSEECSNTPGRKKDMAIHESLCTTKTGKFSLA